LAVIVVHEDVEMMAKDGRSPIFGYIRRIAERARIFDLARGVRQ
jgi:hypothetical protein